MKKLNHVLAAIGFAFILSSCGGGSSSEVPKELSGNSEVAEYFEILDEVIDEYISLIEEMSEAAKTAENAEGDDFGAAMNMFSAAASSTMKLAPMMERMEELEEKGEVLKNDLSPEELEAFINTYTKMLLRLQEASMKMSN